MESDPIPVEIPSQHSSKVGMITLAVLMLAIGLVAGYFFGKGKSGMIAYQTGTPVPTTTDVPVISVSPSATTTPDMTGWKTYTSKKEPTLSFRYPADWTLENMGSTAQENIQIRAPKVGTYWTAINWSADVSGLGGGCPPERPNIVLHEVEPMSHANGLYFVNFGIVGDTDMSPVGVGIVGGDKSDNPPKLGDIGYCLYYPLFKSKLDPNRDMWLRGTVQPQDKAIAKQILESLTY